MKYLKTYEQVNEPLKVGDYAILPIRINNKVSDYIIKILSIRKDKDEIIYEQDKIEPISKKFTKYVAYGRDIKFWSESKEELEIKIKSMKYNL